MEIFVETPTGEKRALKVEATETIESVKAKYIRESGGDPSSVRSFRLQVDLSEDRTLGYYQIKNGDTIQVMSNIVPIFVNKPAEKIAFVDDKTVYDSNLKNGDIIECIVNAIEIFIKMPTGKQVFLKVNRNDTIASVKNQIQTKEGIPQKYQELFYGRKNLEDARTLNDYEIPSGITLHLVQLIIEIFVEMTPLESGDPLDYWRVGEMIALEVHRNDTIGDVKGKIKEKGGVLWENHILDYGTTSLEDDDLTVGDYKIKQGSTLTLRLKDIEIDIIMHSGEIFPLNVKLNETIFSVKTKIKQMKGISPVNQFFRGSSGGWAKDDDTVVSNISYDKYGRKRLSLQMADPFVSIIVAMTTGQIPKRMTFKVNRNVTLAILKSKIAETENINLETHFFCLCDYRSSDDETVEYLLSKNISPRLVLELKEFDISISIKMSDGKTFPITFHPKDTGMHLKGHIQEKEGIHPGQQRLIFVGHMVEDSRTLLSYNIKNGDTLHLALRWNSLELEEFDLSIFIKTLTGKAITFAVHRKDTVMRVKEYIEDKEGIPPHVQRLIFNGRQMEDSSTMVSYNIKNGDTIHVTLGPRGGI